MSQLFSNSARANLTAGISAVATDIPIDPTKGYLFPVANTGTAAIGIAGDWFKVVLQNSYGDAEIVYVRTHVANDGTLSNVLRGQEGTTATAFATGSIVGLRVTALDAQTAAALSETKQDALGFTPYNATNPSGFITSSGSITGNAATATLLSVGTDRTKLDGIAAGANNYVHPENHPASIITQDASNRFVTDAEKVTWNAKQAAGNYATGGGTATGTNTGDETTATIKTKLGVTTLSGSNTGDQTIPTTLPNANAVTFNTTGGAAAGSGYTGAAVLTVDYATVGAAAAGHTHSYQAADGDLLAIGGLVGNSGYLKKTAADTWTLDTSTFATGSGTATGTNTGDQTTITGNAGSATTLSAGADRTKLDGIAASANNYTHPVNHPASIITQDASNRFVTDTEKATWNAKQPAGTYATGGGTATGTNTGDQVIPTTLPASDVYAWAKAATKPAYTATEVGLGNVPNLAFSGTNTGDQTTITGNAGTATTLQTARLIGGVFFNGSADISLPGVNAAGNQNTTGSAATLTTGRTIALTGDVTYTSGSFNGSANVTGTATLAASGVTAGTYTKVTVDAKGRATAGASLASADLPTYTGTVTSSQITTGLGFTPYNATNPSGYITGSGSISGSAGSVSFSGVTSKPTTLSGYGITDAVTRSEFRNFGTITIGPNGAGANCTTAEFIAYLTTLGFFNYSSAVGKCVWNYAGNNDLTDTGFGAIELAGCVIETWTTGTEKHVRLTRPTTGAGGFQVLIYNDQGSTYSPGWRSIITSENIGSQSVNYALSAGAVAWTNVSGRPTAVSSFSNDSGYITASASITGNAATVGSLSVHSGVNNETNKIVRTDVNGYIQAGYIHSTSGNEGNNSNPTRVWGTNGSDSYLRTYLTSALSVSYAATAGNAATATTATSLSGGSISTGTNTVSVGSSGPTNTQFLGSTSYAAAVSFHRAGAYAINMGLDTDTVFRLGGWSDGVNVFRWTSDTSGNFAARGSITAGNGFSGSGAGLTGTASSLSIGGNSGSATVLQTARLLGGVSFNGSADIALPGVNASGTQNTSGTAAAASKLTNGGSIITYGASGLQWMDISGVGGAGTNGVAPSNPTNDWYHHIIANHGNNGGYYVDFAACFHSDTFAMRRVVSGVDAGWKTFWHSGNLSNLNQLTNGPGYATGGGTASGTNTGDQTLPTLSSLGGQAALVSGTNIKTVNSTSLLGSGNIATGDVTLAGTQSLTNKTITDIVFALTGTTPAFTATNGGVQTWTLSAASTPTNALTTGQSIILVITPGAFAITWPSVVWTKQGGSGAAPTLFSAGKTSIVLWMVGAVLYGSHLGDTV